MTYYDDLLAVGIGAVVTGLLLWFFFGPKRAKTTELRGGVQEVEVTVRGGYSPDVIRAQRGVPLRLIFDRQEAGDCSSRVLFSDFGVSASLPAFERTTVDLVPDEVGEFGFACGMNMIHGRLLVEEPDTASDDVTAGRPTAEAEPALHEVRQADFALQGMSCASCVGRIESAIGAVPGVDDVAVNFGTERASVVFDPAVASPGAIVAAVEAIGYHAHEREALATTDGEDRERAARQRRDPRPHPASRLRRRPHASHRGGGDGDRALRRDVGSRRAHEPVGAARAHHARHGLHRLADPPHRLAGAQPPHRGHEHPDHHRHDRRVRLQPAGDPRARRAAQRAARRLLRGGRRHHHPHPARPAARGPGQGRHR